MQGSATCPHCGEAWRRLVTDPVGYGVDCAEREGTLHVEFSARIAKVAQFMQHQQTGKVTSTKSRNTSSRYLRGGSGGMNSEQIMLFLQRHIRWYIAFGVIGADF